MDMIYRVFAKTSKDAVKVFLKNEPTFKGRGTRIEKLRKNEDPFIRATTMIKEAYDSIIIVQVKGKWAKRTEEASLHTRKPGENIWLMIASN